MVNGVSDIIGADFQTFKAITANKATADGGYSVLLYLYSLCRLPLFFNGNAVYQ